MTTRTERIHAILTAEFAPEALELKDDSHKHAKHAHRMEQVGHAPDVGETHYRLAMVSARFAGQTRVARSRAVHEALDAEFKSGLHALALDLKAPGE
ncbi:BolA family protein [Acidiphilium acidophilum]|uniref:BolA family protein n=1 Tax=Acidiphilium acidophilum TaxID=76588 RepID=A0AAW9DM40_ACIAO|nr:BolA family protein [Acidiphilium acidophilum]MDX5930224.1 BolA family protein [Acidiphilium acidophilum]GBQ24187.1 stress response and cell division protein BolA [Acidiphilium acidophilum DSM 700]